MPKMPSVADRLRIAHYLNEDGYLVFTERFHLDRGECCGNRCRHCPFVPKARKGNRAVAPEFNGDGDR